MNRLASPASRSSVILGFIAEMERWKMFCAGLQQQDSKQSLEEAIALADPNYYPNLHAIFRALLTMPVGSVPCERSFLPKATFFGFIEFSHDIFSTKIYIPMNEQTSQSSKSIFCHCRSAPASVSSVS
jgi:hypothetical protein